MPAADPDERPSSDPDTAADTPGEAERSGAADGAVASPPGGRSTSAAAVDPARAALLRARAAARTRGDDASPRGRAGDRDAEQARRSAARRGEEPRSGARPDDRDPQPLGPAVRRLVRERGWEAEAAVGGVVGRWAEIVGDEVAVHAVVESFDADAGRLVVRASSTAWATQLRLMLATLRSRLDDELGHGVVREVTVLGPSSPSWRKGPRHVPGRGPRDTYG